MGGHRPFGSVFKRPRPEGRWSLAHPLREPLRAVGQSLVAWPAAALAAIMMAAPKDGVEQPAIVLLALQATVVYPIIAIAAIALHFLLARLGKSAWAPLPLIIPLALVGTWLVTLTLFLVKYGLSIVRLA